MLLRMCFSWVWVCLCFLPLPLPWSDSPPLTITTSPLASLFHVLHIHLPPSSDPPRVSILHDGQLNNSLLYSLRMPFYFDEPLYRSRSSVFSTQSCLVKSMRGAIDMYRVYSISMLFLQPHFFSFACLLTCLCSLLRMRMPLYGFYNVSWFLSLSDFSKRLCLETSAAF